MRMFCIKCGESLPEKANFCLNCGSPTNTDPTKIPVFAQFLELSLNGGNATCFRSLSSDEGISRFFYNYLMPRVQKPSELKIELISKTWRVEYYKYNEKNWLSLRDAFIYFHEYALEHGWKQLPSDGVSMYKFNR
jgi:hypothetical protein